MINWLPALTTLDDSSGDWKRYLEALYAFFKADFVTERAYFRSRPIGIKRYPLSDEKEATFWHLISSGSVEADREPDFPRCERIRWPRALIDHESDSKAKVWFNTRDGERRFLLLIEEERYLVVLAERKSYLLLWTSFLVDHGHRMEKLLREYDDFKKKLGSPP